MTAIKTLIAAALIAAGTAAAPVFAQSYSHLDPITAGQKTRAEVQADLEIYRLSGLAAVEQSESYGYDVARRDQAKAKYAELRNSPVYAALVQKYTEKAANRNVAAR